jgi:leader peptidase (prepilin peptidase)/N-methyltransferase
MEAASIRPDAGGALPNEGREFRTLLPVGRARTMTAATAVALTVLSFAEFGWSGRALLGAVLCPTLVLLAAIDLKHRLLPNAIVFPAALLTALLVAAFDAGQFFAHLEAGLALFGFLFLFAAIFPGGLGMGDAKTGLLLGLALGSRTLPAMMIAFAAVFVAALWVLARHGVSARKQTLPFGPFLALGGALAFFLT